MSYEMNISGNREYNFDNIRNVEEVTKIRKECQSIAQCSRLKTIAAIVVGLAALYFGGTFALSVIQSTKSLAEFVIVLFITLKVGVVLVIPPVICAVFAGKCWQEAKHYDDQAHQADLRLSQLGHKTTKVRVDEAENSRPPSGWAVLEGDLDEGDVQYAGIPPTYQAPSGATIEVMD